MILIFEFSSKIYADNTSINEMLPFISTFEVTL